MTSIPTIQLRDGTPIPQIAYGSGTAWFKRDAADPINPDLVAATSKVLSLGYRHLDTAETYGTEPEIGAGIHDFLRTHPDVKREELFITSKLWPSVKDPLATLRQTLKSLGLEYLDLWLLHCPFFHLLKDPSQVGATIPDTWRGMEEAQRAGLVRHIGVSNFNVAQTRTLLETAEIKPFLNQFELNPYCHDEELVAFNKENGIVTGAYSPLAPLTRFKDGPVDAVAKEIAERKGVSEARVLLAWGVKGGWVVVTMTKTEERMKDFGAVGEVSLNEEEWKRITEAGRKEHHRAFWNEEYEKK